MVNNNKILTVSYGTFSCTLEGFDDSFGTMKAISEYFRDLAADDRYFGAEPPTPDAEMLARIAEREISRRVEAHREENTYVLRADPGSVLPLAAKTADAAPAPQAPAETTVAPAPTNAPAAEPVAESVAEPVAETKPVSPVSVDAPAAEPEAKVAANDAADTADLSNLSALVAESVAETPDEIAGAPAPAAPEAPAKAEDVSTPAPSQADPESVAAKLQRIRDVVSKTERPSSFTEDEHAEELLLDDDDATAPFLSDSDDALEAAVTEDGVAEELADLVNETTAVEDGAEDSIAALLNDMSEDDDDDDDDDDDIALDSSDLEDDINDDAFNDALESDDFEEDFEDDESIDEPAPLRARVVKMKKTDFEAAIADGVLEEDESSQTDKSSSLSDQEEAELLRELAEVEAELGQAFDDVDDDVEDEIDAIEEQDILEKEEEEDAAGNLFNSDGEAAPRSTRLPRDADVQMTRILEETNTQLEEETGKGRRNAIAHLRAAVAATEAERGVGGDLGVDGRDTEVYRDDLETVVRPRRPAAKAQTARPAPPLKLVAEQRIDTPAPSAPVQPRRVRAAATTTAPKHPQNTEFADYIDDVGAYNLGEVLEAAASYMAFVEGQEAFSRPQLMSKLNATEHADTTREDRLRSFGQLLREGKIRKLGGGRFEASDSISYRPEARAAGG